MNLVNKAQTLVTSPTLKVFSFRDSSHLAYDVTHLLNESKLVIGKLLVESKIVRGDSFFFLMTEDGTLYELVVLDSGTSILSYVDPTKWTPIDYYADDDLEDEEPLYYNDVLSELRHFNQLLSEVVISNNAALWQSLNDDPLSTYLNAQTVTKLEIQGN